VWPVTGVVVDGGSVPTLSILVPTGSSGRVILLAMSFAGVGGSLVTCLATSLVTVA
jgi:hypothetical protein